MTVDDFFSRVEQMIVSINEGATAGQNKIGITSDDRINILSSNTIDEASKYLLAAGIPEYVIETAISGKDLLDVNADSAALFAAGEQTGLFGNQDAIIGVPANYLPPRESATDFYTQNDLVNLFAGLEVEEIAGIQADLVNAKLLTIGDGFIPGEWDAPTQSAFSRVLRRANMGGVTEYEKQTGAAWRNVLEEYVANPVPTIPDDDVFLPPDPATNAQQVKSLYARELNREPSAYELKLLSNELYKQSEAAFKQSQELTDAAQEPATFTGDDLMAGEYGNYAAENVQQTIDEEGLSQIDPQSRMRQKFDGLIENEKARLGENYSGRNTRTAILNSISARTGRPQ
jgi:hypothetical protein